MALVCAIATLLTVTIKTLRQTRKWHTPLERLNLPPFPELLRLHRLNALRRLHLFHRNGLTFFKDDLVFGKVKIDRGVGVGYPVRVF